jgi:hypothetical protein
MTKARQWLLGTVATAALAGVFMLYARPDFMVQMVNQVWGCF